MSGRYGGSPAVIWQIWQPLNDDCEVVHNSTANVGTFTRLPRRRELLLATWPAKEYIRPDVHGGRLPAEVWRCGGVSSGYKKIAWAANSCWERWQAPQCVVDAEEDRSTDKRNGAVTSDRRIQPVSCRRRDVRPADRPRIKHCKVRESPARRVCFSDAALLSISCCRWARLIVPYG